MSILRSPESAYVKERAKWESIPTIDCPVALRPYTFQPYPAAFYKAERPAQGGPAIFEEVIVESDTEAANMRSRGWGQGHGEALQMLVGREQALAQGAAERAHSDRRMSTKAQVEAEIADESTPHHLPEIPTKPVRKRRTKAQMAADAAKH